MSDHTGGASSRVACCCAAAQTCDVCLSSTPSSTQTAENTVSMEMHLEVDLGSQQCCCDARQAMAAPQLQHSAAAEALHLAPEGAADAAQLHHHAIFWLGSADAGQITYYGRGWRSDADAGCTVVDREACA